MITSREELHQKLQDGAVLVDEPSGTKVIDTEGIWPVDPEVAFRYSRSDMSVVGVGPGRIEWALKEHYHLFTRRT